MSRDQVFISYSHVDSKWLKKLQTMFAPLRRQGLDVWDDTRIDPGKLWKEEIKQALARAKVAVLLVTPDFLASDFINENELPPLLEAAANEGLIILWVPIRHSLYKKTAIAAFRAAYNPQTPVASLNEAEQDAALLSIAERIEKAFQTNSRPSPTSAPKPAPSRAVDPPPAEAVVEVEQEQRHDRNEATEAAPVVGRSTIQDLDRSNIQKIVNLLTPLMGGENERRALLILALGHGAPLLRQLDLTGPVEPFLVNMIKALVDYGKVAPGQQALWALLEVVRERVGVDRQTEIDSLYQVINALGRNDDQGLRNQTRLKKEIDDLQQHKPGDAFRNWDRAVVAAFLPVVLVVLVVVAVLGLGLWKSTSPPIRIVPDQGAATANPAPVSPALVTPTPTRAAPVTPTPAPAPADSTPTPASAPAKPAASTPASPPTVPVESIHGLPEDQVKKRQEKAAQDLKTKVEFLDKLKDDGEGPLMVVPSCPTCPEMVIIPAGSFLMGSPEGEYGRGENEVQQWVTVNAFMIGRYEVTFAQYNRFASATGRPLPDDDHTDGGEYPVVNITWGDAQAYVEWLANKTGMPFRLPTEAEWEYAARAGSSDASPWGHSYKDACTYANVYDTTSEQLASGFDPRNTLCSDDWPKTAPVGRFPANSFGLHDMLGNVWEFTATCRNPTPSADGTCTEHVIRGGSWRNGLGTPTRDELRYAERQSVSSSSRTPDIGFRVALTL